MGYNNSSGISEARPHYRPLAGREAGRPTRGLPAWPSTSWIAFRNGGEEAGVLQPLTHSLGGFSLSLLVDALLIEGPEARDLVKVNGCF